MFCTDKCNVGGMVSTLSNTNIVLFVFQVAYLSSSQPRYFCCLLVVNSLNDLVYLLNRTHWHQAWSPRRGLVFIGVSLVYRHFSQPDTRRTISTKTVLQNTPRSPNPFLSKLRSYRGVPGGTSTSRLREVYYGLGWEVKVAFTSWSWYTDWQVQSAGRPVWNKTDLRIFCNRHVCCQPIQKVMTTCWTYNLRKHHQQPTEAE